MSDFFLFSISSVWDWLKKILRQYNKLSYWEGLGKLYPHACIWYCDFICNLQGVRECVCAVSFSSDCSKCH